MKITTPKPSTPFDSKVLGNCDTITLETSKGKFRVHEEADGSLSIRESSHYHLAVLPKTGNAVSVYAIDGADFLTQPKEVGPLALDYPHALPGDGDGQWYENRKGTQVESVMGMLTGERAEAHFLKRGPWRKIDPPAAPEFKPRDRDVVDSKRKLLALPAGAILFSEETKDCWTWHGINAKPLVATGTGGGYTYADSFLEQQSPLAVLHIPASA